MLKHGVIATGTGCSSISLISTNGSIADDAVAEREKYKVDGISVPSKAFYAGDKAAYDQAFREYRKTRRHEVLNERYLCEQFSDDHFERNAYLSRLGITGIWFEKGQYEYVEGMLRLARNELRYRGVIPGTLCRPVT